MSRSIIFSIIEIRPDIIFAMSIVCCFTNKLSQQYTKALKTIMRYFKVTKILGITYSGEKRDVLIIKDYFNSNQASDNTTRKSISRFIFIPNGGRVS